MLALCTLILFTQIDQNMGMNFILCAQINKNVGIIFLLYGHSWTPWQCNIENLYKPNFVVYCLNTVAKAEVIS